MEKGSKIYPYFASSNPSSDFLLGLLYNEDNYPFPLLLAEKDLLPQVFLCFLACFFFPFSCHLLLYGILNPLAKPFL